MRGLPRDQLRKLRRILLALDSAAEVGEVGLPGFRLHPLKGTMRGLWAVQVTANWRVTFRFQDNDAHDVDLVDYH